MKEDFIAWGYMFDFHFGKYSLKMLLCNALDNKFSMIICCFR